MIAKNAQAIIDARLRGFKPEGLTLVSLVGQIVADNPVVQADPATAYDWRWTHGLEVCVYINEHCNWVHIVKAIAMQKPAYLAVWQHACHWGAKVYIVPTEEDLAKPISHWEWELDFLAWLDFQNDDFVACLTYGRDEKGMPYAVNP